MSESCYYLWVPLLLLVIIYILSKAAKWIFLKAKLHIWKNTPSDVVIIHGYPPTKLSPNPSPFVVKLLTFLHMTKIPYKLDFGMIYPHGPKGKSPWISLNGTHLGDTELIMEFLNKQFSKDLNRSYTDEQLAIGTAVRLMLEEHAFWGMALERFVYGGNNFTKLSSHGYILDKIIQILFRTHIKTSAYYQGLGRHSETELEKLIVKDLKAVSSLLGTKKFILGEDFCQDDCGIFGILAQFIWGLPNCPYQKLIDEELPNLKEYCQRIKHTFFDNWDDLLAK